MTHKKLPVNTIAGVSPGATAQVTLPIGEMIHAIYLEATVSNSAQPPQITDALGLIQLVRNGNIQRQFLPTELDALNTLDSETLRANVSGATGSIVGYLTPPTIGGSGSSGFVVGDQITFNTGTVAPGGSVAIFVVTAVSSGAPTAIRVLNPGQYSVAPSTTAPKVYQSAAGAVGSLTLTGTASVITALAPNLYGSSVLLDNTTPQTGDTVTYRLGIYFADPSRDTASEGNVFALPTSWPDPNNLPNGRINLQSLTLNVAIPNNASTSNQALKVFIETTPELGALIDANGNLAQLNIATSQLVTVSGSNFNVKTASPFQKMVKWLRAPLPYTAAGDLLFQPDRSAGDVYQDLHFFSGAGGDPIGSCTLTYNGVSYLNVPKATNDEINIRRGTNELAVDPLRFDIIFDNIHALDGLPTLGATQFDVTPNLTTANASTKNLTVIRRVYGNPN